MTSQSLMSKLHRRTFLRSIALTALLAIGAGALVQSPAIAHQQKAAITRIIFNERTGTVEVVHRFFLHDAEHAVRQVLDRNADIIGSATTRQQFADYVEQNFVMHNQRGAEIPLQSIGHEIDGNFFWVYQEVAVPEGLTGLSVVFNALREIWSDQTNTVNVEIAGEVKTLSFYGATETLSVDL